MLKHKTDVIIDNLYRGKKELRDMSKASHTSAIRGELVQSEKEKE